MVEIKAGEGLDRAVAAVVSGKVTVHPEGLFSPALPIPFQPSADLNAAFEAAEAVGLFGEWSLGLCGKQWCLMSEADCEAGREQLATGATPALAICAAILELSKEEQ